MHEFLQVLSPCINVSSRVLIFSKYKAYIKSFFLCYCLHRKCLENNCVLHLATSNLACFYIRKIVFCFLNLFNKMVWDILEGIQVFLFLWHRSVARRVLTPPLKILRSGVLTLDRHKSFLRKSGSGLSWLRRRSGLQPTLTLSQCNASTGLDFLTIIRLVSFWRPSWLRPCYDIIELFLWDSCKYLVFLLEFQINLEFVLFLMTIYFNFQEIFNFQSNLFNFSIIDKILNYTWKSRNLGWHEATFETLTAILVPESRDSLNHSNFIFKI
jgi:hypothetical protein